MNASDCIGAFESRPRRGRCSWARAATFSKNLPMAERREEMIFDHETESAKRLALQLAPESDESIKEEVGPAIAELLDAINSASGTDGVIEGRWLFRVARELERRGAL